MTHISSTVHSTTSTTNHISPTVHPRECQPPATYKNTFTKHEITSFSHKAFHILIPLHVTLINGVFSMGNAFVSDIGARSCSPALHAVCVEGGPAVDHLKGKIIRLVLNLRIATGTGN